MEYRRFPLSCECGGEPKQIMGVGFSANRELVIHWRCARCRNRVCTVRPLEDCWLDSFGAPPVKKTPPSSTADDRRFLHSIGVRFADDSGDSED